MECFLVLDQALVLIIISLGFAIMIGLLPPRRAMAIIIGLVLAAQLLKLALIRLPCWLSLLILLGLGLVLLRKAGALLGKGVFSDLVNLLKKALGAVLRFGIWIVVGCLRIIYWGLCGISYGRLRRGKRSAAKRKPVASGNVMEVPRNQPRTPPTASQQPSEASTGEPLI